VLHSSKFTTRGNALTITRRQVPEMAVDGVRFHGVADMCFSLCVMSGGHDIQYALGV